MAVLWKLRLCYEGLPVENKGGKALMDLVL